MSEVEKTLEIKQKPYEELTHYQESLLKKRKADDADKRRRLNARAQQKLDLGRKKKLLERE